MCLLFCVRSCASKIVYPCRSSVVSLHDLCTPSGIQSPDGCPHVCRGPLCEGPLLCLEASGRNSAGGDGQASGHSNLLPAVLPRWVGRGAVDSIRHYCRVCKDFSIFFMRTRGTLLILSVSAVYYDSHLFTQGLPLSGSARVHIFHSSAPHTIHHWCESLPQDWPHQLPRGSVLLASHGFLSSLSWILIPDLKTHDIVLAVYLRMKELFLQSMQAGVCLPSSPPPFPLCFCWSNRIHGFRVVLVSGV